VVELGKIGINEFKALEILEKQNNYSVKSVNCGSQHLFVPNKEWK
jgi:hypothetical protein